jgi:hypothetical protein
MLKKYDLTIDKWRNICFESEITKEELKQRAELLNQTLQLSKSEKYKDIRQSRPV